MLCPCCESESKVIDSRECRKTIRRRRRCFKCGHRYTTLEVPYRDNLYPWRQCKICGDKVRGSTQGWALCPVHIREKDNKRRKLRRAQDRTRRKLKPSPRDILREKYPRRIANLISKGKMLESEAKPFLKEGKK